MPLCYFRPREVAHDFRIPGWVDLQRNEVAELDTTLADLLALDSPTRTSQIAELRATASRNLSLDDVRLLPPVDEQEIWAAGVTYERSRDARMEESTQEDIYDRVYDAARPEIFFKAAAHR